MGTSFILEIPKMTFPNVLKNIFAVIYPRKGSDLWGGSVAVVSPFCIFIFLGCDAKRIASMLFMEDDGCSAWIVLFFGVNIYFHELILKEL